MKRFLGITFCVLFVLGVLGAIDYDPEKFKKIEKVADKLVGMNLKVLKKYNVKKVVILECTGEFLQSKEVMAGAFDKTVSKSFAETMAYATGLPQYYKKDWSMRSTLKLDDDYYSIAVDQVYAMVVKMFRDCGIEVIDKEFVINNEIYKGWEFKEQKFTKGYTGGMFSDSVVKEGIKRATTGLGLFPDGLKMIKVEKEMPYLMRDLGADAAVQIKFYIDKGKKGEPILGYFNIHIHSGILVQGNKVYLQALGSPKIPNMWLNEAIASKSDISGSTKGSVDMTKYNTAFIELVNAAVQMYKYKLHEFLPEYQPLPEPVKEPEPDIEPEPAEETQPSGTVTE